MAPGLGHHGSISPAIVSHGQPLCSDVVDKGRECWSTSSFLSTELTKPHAQIGSTDVHFRPVSSLEWAPSAHGVSLAVSQYCNGLHRCKSFSESYITDVEFSWANCRPAGGISLASIDVSFEEPLAYANTKVWGANIEGSSLEIAAVQCSSCFVDSNWTVVLLLVRNIINICRIDFMHAAPTYDEALSVRGLTDLPRASIG